VNYTDQQALERALYYLTQGGKPFKEDVSLYNFRELYQQVVDYIQFGMSTKQRAGVPLEWAERFAALAGDFEARVKADPLILYRPRTPKHQAVHESTAFIRYLMAANTVGKSLLAYVEDIWCASGQRHWAGNRGNVAIVSTGHTVYSEKAFIPKMITGDDGDPLSPYLPEGGKWLHSFDQRKYLARIACPECAEAGKTRQCPHTKSIQCLSADSGKERLMAFAVKLAHVDEHISEEVFNELILRTRRGNVNGRMFLTATPLAGPDSYEVRNLYNLYKKRPDDNWLDATTKKERYVEVFNISMYDCVGTPGGPTLGQIEAFKNIYSPSEFRVRIHGEPMPLGDSMFDLNILDKMEVEHCSKAEYGTLELAPGNSVEALEYADSLTWVQRHHFTEEAFEGFHIWEHPEAGACYVIGADVASGSGVTSRDASVAYVFRMTPDLHLDMVACHFSYLDPYDYAREVKKLAIYFNQALVIPEINAGSIGSAFLSALYKELSYSSVFVGETPPEQLAAGADSRMGVTTTAVTKPAIVMSLLHYIHNGTMILRDKEAISECRTFQKTRTESGMNYRYAAANGAHDDRVMALGMVAFACKVHPDQVAAFAIAPTSTKRKPSPPLGVTPRPKYKF